jgi:hypothetical protein
VTDDLAGIVRDLCANVPRAIGAVLCDFEGEAVVCALGPQGAPAEAERRAKEHVPHRMELNMPIGEFLIRLAGAEPCGLLRMFEDAGRRRGIGILEAIEIRYQEVEMIIRKLPNDFYLMLLLRTPAVTAEARRSVSEATDRLRVHVS